MTGVIERDERARPGLVRLNIKQQDGRIIGFKPNPYDRKPGQPTEQFEAEWYDYWAQQIGKTVTFSTDRFGFVLAVAS